MVLFLECTSDYVLNFRCKKVLNTCLVNIGCKYCLTFLLESGFKIGPSLNFIVPVLFAPSGVAVVVLIVWLVSELARVRKKLVARGR